MNSVQGHAVVDGEGFNRRAPTLVGAPAQRSRLRVLHVEDSEDDAALVLHELRGGDYDVDVLRVETAEQMRAALRDRTWDVIISDHALPSFSAPKAFLLMRELGIDLPFIIVSGTMGEEVAVEAMRTGVHDYLLKDNLRRLNATIERELREAAQRVEQRRIREQLFITDRMASVGVLAAGVAHEINNPLSVVLGSIDVALEELAAAASLAARREHRGPPARVADRRARGGRPRAPHRARPARLLARRRRGARTRRRAQGRRLGAAHGAQRDPPPRQVSLSISTTRRRYTATNRASVRSS